MTTLSQGERALLAVTEADESLTPKTYAQWCRDNNLDAGVRVEIRAKFLRAFIIVEGAHLKGLTLPKAQRDYLQDFGVDPAIRRVSTQLAIDWHGAQSSVELDQARIERDSHEQGFETDDERKFWIVNETKWRKVHDIKNRPYILGDLDLDNVDFPVKLRLYCIDIRHNDDRDQLGSIRAQTSKLGQLGLNGCKLVQLVAPGCKIDGRLDGRFISAQELTVIKAQIKGDLELNQARLSNPGKIALNCNGAQISASVFLSTGFKAVGEVNFVGANIGGQFSAVKGQFSNPEKIALHCSEAQISGSVLLRNGFKANGAVQFIKAHIQGALQLQKSTIEHDEEKHPALGLDSAVIGGDLIFDDPWLDDDHCARITGRVDLSGAQCAILHDRSVNNNKAECWLNGDLILDGFQYRRLGPKSPTNWNARKRWLDRQPKNDRSGGVFKLLLWLKLPTNWNELKRWLDRKPKKDRSGGVFKLLQGLKLPANWNELKRWLDRKPKKDRSGGVFKLLQGLKLPANWNELKRWLDRKPKKDRSESVFKPQPFEQLSTVLRQSGYARDADEVALSKHYRMHRSGKAGLLSGVFRWLFMWPIGYGYRPQYLFVGSVFIILLSTGIYDSAYRLGHITPAQPHGAIVQIAQSVAGQDIAHTCALIEHDETVPPFNGLVYVIDTFTPLVDLDQETSWKPALKPRCVKGLDAIHPSKNWILNGLNTAPWFESCVGRLARNGYLFVLKYFLMILGFSVTASITVALSGLLRRD